MSPESRLVAATCLRAWGAAGAGSREVPPERRGTFLASGFGCLETTQKYLDGILRDGMAAASPLLFAESLASAPLGHAAIALDARGPSTAFHGGDAASLAALGEACRAIRTGRIDRAVCAAFDLMPGILVEILARLAGRGARRKPAFVGEAAVALVLEDLRTARLSGATIHAEILGTGSAGDPAARPGGWSEDETAWAAAHASALRQAARTCGAARGGSVALVFRHAPPSASAARAELRALDRLEGDSASARRMEVHRVFGAYAAAGGLSIVAASLAAGAAGGPVLVSAGGWGGSTAAAVMAAAEA